jgi:hypothetical protein
VTDQAPGQATGQIRKQARRATRRKPPRSVFTTGQVARICCCCPKKVADWVDTGKLRGYRIPGSLDRRIPRESLVRFLKEHGMPVPVDLDDARCVLLIGCDFPVALQFQAVHAASAFDAGVMAAQHRPIAAVLSLAVLGRGAALAVAAALAATGVPCAALLCEDTTEADAAALLAGGFAVVVPWGDAQGAAGVALAVAGMVGQAGEGGAK